MSRSLARQGAAVSAATMLSRILGLVREQFFAALLGASAAADAFVAAFRIPNLLRDLFAEGALASAFVPEFRKALDQNGWQRAIALGNRVANTLALLITGLVIGAVIFAPHIVNGLAGDFVQTPGKLELTVTLARIMMPFLIVVSLAAVAMGMLNAQERFVGPALAPALFNVVSIGTGIVLWVMGLPVEHAVMGWAIGTLLGGVAQLAVQLPSLWHAGWRPQLLFDVALRDPSVRRIAIAMGPAIIGVAAVQVNIFVNTAFAASEPGAVTWLNFAFRFLYLPIGVFGVAIATVSTTRYAQAAAKQDLSALAMHLRGGLQMVFFLCVPAMLGLVAIGEPLMRLTYERGQFGAHDTLATTRALEWYAIGLVAYAAVKVLAPAFYAVGRARIAMIASVSAVAANVILSVALHDTYGYRALALGTAVAATVNCGILYIAAGRVVEALPHRALVSHLLRVIVAAGCAAGAAYGVRLVCERQFGVDGLGVQLLTVFAPIVVATLIYGGAALVLRLPEVRELGDRLRRRTTQ